MNGAHELACCNCNIKGMMFVIRHWWVCSDGEWTYKVTILETFAFTKLIPNSTHQPPHRSAAERCESLQPLMNIAWEVRPDITEYACFAPCLTILNDILQPQEIIVMPHKL